MADTNQIHCPHCDELIDVQSVLAQQVEERLRKEQAQKLKIERDALAEKEKALAAKSEMLEKQIDDSVKQRLHTEKDKLEKRMAEELGEQLTAMREELDRKSQQVKNLNKTQIALEKLKREKDELEEAVEAKLEAKFSDRLKEARASAQKKAAEENELKLRQAHEKNQQLVAQLQEAQRKAEQSSMQLQGEAQELAIEEFLQNEFPMDSIEEIKKGARGGDCVQTVNGKTDEPLGTIYYESKRTKSFQPAWIEKFKADMVARGANVGVLVTDAMPSDMDRMGIRSGVYICRYEDFKSLCVILRESLIRVSHALSSQENKGDKMVMLYDYLTGSEFQMQLEAIVEGFVQMKEDLDGERRSMERQWKKREKQIEKVLLNTTRLHGSLQGIAGSAIPAVKQLELPDDNSELF